ncbi:V-type ATP synthase subunit B [Proteiniphilum acetatigenes]|uniref:V-type ATP synthase subunit B n=1 Tax=Proteiniphilum acetatigenes TaxID=294710 RepID=UPI000374AC39|nr:V-type ATP synthase subunit B [Proteiniphilum acetatigenes]SFK91162.1 V/A-type H+-transporting ATPase subunit B [Porphyromonadaceae bacterium KH3CP3RA]
MAKAFQKIYTKITQITKATCSVKATNVGYDELATVEGRLAQVVKIIGDEVTLQIFEGTEGIPTNAEVIFMGKSPSLKVSEQLAGRFFNAYGDPIDGGPVPEGEERPIGGPSVNPVRRKQPSELIATGISGIDLNNTLVSGQKIPFFADPDQPFNQVMATVALRAQTDKIILGGMGMTNDDYLYFKNVFSNAGALDRIISFMNTTEDPAVERLLIPDMALTAAEYFAVDKNEKVLVLLTDMTSYADALSIVSNRMDQIPSKDSMPGSLYSDLAKIYEKAAQFPSGGSITIVAVTTLSGGDITHAVPDNTGYITEGQLFLRRDSDVGKVVVDPFRSLSRLKQLVQGKKTREDHPQVMNAAVRLYADAANAKTKMENGFDLTDYDTRALSFALDYSEKILAIDVNLDTTEMLDNTWKLLSRHFKPAEVNMKQELIDTYWQQ